MAEDTQQGLQLPQQDAGVAFRTEMAVTNFFLGYWKHIVAVTGLVLVGFFLYGQYANWYQKGQRAASAQIADIEAKAPALIGGFGQEGDSDALVQAGDALTGVGAETTGAARIEAYLKAAEYYRRGGAVEQQRAALEAASDHAGGVLGYAVQAALANLDLEQGAGDAAVERLRTVRGQLDGYLAEQATLDLALMLEHVGKPQDAIALYDEFLTTWPDSDQTALAQERRARLAGGEG